MTKQWDSLLEVKVEGCPQCGKEQLCPCSNCLPKHPEAVVWKWIDGEARACGYCGYTMHCDSWLYLDMERYYKRKES